MKRIKHLSILIFFVSASAFARTYSSGFPKSENPISEANNWINGALGGANLWGNVRTTPGLAFGVNEPTRFGDPTAILTGTWGRDQTVEGIVHVGAVPRKCCHEVELRLRTTITTGSITGYEAYCSVVPKTPYCNIARWNGPNRSYWNIAEVNGVFVKEGDVLLATVTGSNPATVTLFKNGLQIAQAIDSGAAGGGFGAFAHGRQVAQALAFMIRLIVGGAILASAALWLRTPLLPQFLAHSVTVSRNVPRKLECLRSAPGSKLLFLQRSQFCW